MKKYNTFLGDVGLPRAPMYCDVTDRLGPKLLKQQQKLQSAWVFEVLREHYMITEVKLFSD